MITFWDFIAALILIEVWFERKLEYERQLIKKKPVGIFNKIKKLLKA